MSHLQREGRGFESRLPLKEILDDVYSHYQIDDLRLDLNGRHPLIMKGLSVNEVLASLIKNIKSGIEGDNRFNLEIKMGKQVLEVRVAVS